ncbi:MAG: hypothetical protein IJ050_11010 [Clostridia bacterium]|nr:hypothetical protein [Clostridia bacterium]
MKLNTLINEPITYTATFIADGNVVDIVEYYSGTGEVIEPVPPAKEGYWWHWDNYELTGNITINAIYETIGYIACFVNGNNIIAQIPYTIETENITPPPVPEKAGYTSEWEDYSLEVGGITVQVLFTPNIYEVDLVVDGEVIGTIDYTYDDENPDLPTVPEKKGYTGEWVINQDDGNVVIHAEYTPINYYATFMADGNQVGDKVPFTVESISIIEPAVPEKEGYSKDAFIKAFFDNSVFGEIKPSDEVSFSANNHTDRIYKKKYIKNTGYSIIQGNGVACGKLIGGHGGIVEYAENSIIKMTDSDFRNRILFFEDIEQVCDCNYIQQFFQRLGQKGWLQLLNGIIIGQMKIGENFERLSETVKNVISGEYNLTDLPVVYGLNIGHISPITIIPYGGEAKISIDNNIRFVITESLVR